MCVRERAYELAPFYGAGALTQITKRLLTDIIAAAAAAAVAGPDSQLQAVWLGWKLILGKQDVFGALQVPGQIFLKRSCSSLMNTCVGPKLHFTTLKGKKDYDISMLVGSHWFGT